VELGKLRQDTGLHNDRIERTSPVPLRRTELPSGTIELARFLIGKTLIRDLRHARLSGRIVETEAYPPGDASGHAYRGSTARNRSLFLGHGYAYVYLNYGVSYLLNVSSEEPGIGAGILLRALEPIDGISQMEHNRRTPAVVDLMRGPGRLTEAMAIDMDCDGEDLCRGQTLWLGTAIRPTGSIGQSVRIGISRERGQLRRFYERSSPFVSGPKRLRL
jgi:DNA-3-methyladenine glycosylase